MTENFIIGLLKNKLFVLNKQTKELCMVNYKDKDDIITSLVSDDKLYIFYKRDNIRYLDSFQDMKDSLKKINKIKVKNFTNPRLLSNIILWNNLLLMFNNDDYNCEFYGLYIYNITNMKLFIKDAVSHNSYPFLMLNNGNILIVGDSHDDLWDNQIYNIYRYKFDI